ncbi:hypothetical protein [Larkinella ripae]
MHWFLEGIKTGAHNTWWIKGREFTLNPVFTEKKNNHLSKPDGPSSPRSKTVRSPFQPASENTSLVGQAVFGKGVAAALISNYFLLKVTNFKSWPGL